MHSNKPQLLCPAGDWEALRAGVANGADAVYFGLENFNARHRAENFKLEELGKIVEYLHGHNVQGYLTFNTLIFSGELPAAEEYARAIAASGVDAVIVQDLGLARLLKRLSPELPLHASTQMTLTEPRGLRFAQGLGLERVVLPRELSIEDIRRLAGQTTMGLEVFIHGALCVAYSGQCLTSESLGGRSANRGQCAQACRLPYELVVDGEVRDLADKAYLLSPQDLAAHDLIGPLVELGISAFKIEGRLKSAHYVAAAAQVYRGALDAALKHQAFTVTPQQRGDLEQTFSRGFTGGFLRGVNHQELVAARFPKARGQKVGKVVRVTGRGVVVELQPSPGVRRAAGTPPSPFQGEGIKPGDGVVFDQGHPEQDEQGGRVFAVVQRGPRQIEIEMGHGDVNLRAIEVGAIVWKTDDPAIRRRLEHSFSRDLIAHRRPLNVRVIARAGEALVIEARDGEKTVRVQSAEVLSIAQNRPVTVELLREQLGRLGDTPYELGEVELETCGRAMAPKSMLNDLRRKAVAELLGDAAPVRAPVRLDALIGLRNEAFNLEAADQEERAVLHVMVRTMEQLEAVLAHPTSIGDRALLPSPGDPGGRPPGSPPSPCKGEGLIYADFEDIRRYRDAVARCRAAGRSIALATLRIIKPHEEGLLRQILDCRPDAVLVRNLGALTFFREHAPELPLIGDYSLNVSNELTAGLLVESGLSRMVPSYDLSWEQMAAMMRRIDPGFFEVVVHQHMPMFHMEHCVIAHTLSNGRDYRDCGRPCDTHRVDLRDRTGRSHPLVADVGCRNTLFNGQAQTGLEYIAPMRKLGVRDYRVELLRQTGDEVGPLLDEYAQVLADQRPAAVAARSLRVLSQLGVTRGTLERE